MTAKIPAVAVVLLLILSGAMDGPPAQAEEFLYVHNTLSGEISKIGIPAHEVVAEIEIGLYMDYLAASPDGSTVYVNRIDGLPETPGVAVGETGELIALDSASDTVLWRLQLDGMPHHMSVSKDGGLIFVPYYDTWWLAVVDVQRREVIKKIFLGHGSHGTKLSADGRRLYVGSMMNDTISIIDTQSLERVGRIAFRDGVRPFAITADEQRMYVQLSRFHGFEVVDLPAREVIRSVDLPALDRGIELPEFYPHTVNHGIALSPDERLLFANGSAGDYVAVYRHPQLELVKTIPVGDDPNSIAFSRDGRFAYVTNRGSDDLSVLSVAELREIERIELGDYPLRMVVVDVPETPRPSTVRPTTARPTTTTTRAPTPRAPEPAASARETERARPTATDQVAAGGETGLTLPPPPEGVRVLSPAARNSQDRSRIVMESPMALELEIGPVEKVPEGYGWNSDELDGYELAGTTIQQVGFQHRRRRGRKDLVVTLRFHTRAFVQRFGLEVDIVKAEEAVLTEQREINVGRSLAQHLDKGYVEAELTFELSPDEFGSLFTGSRPRLKVVLTTL